MNGESILRVRIQAKSLDDIRAFVDENQPDVGCRAIARKADDGFSIDVYMPENEIDTARSSDTYAGVTLEVIENATEIGLQRQGEVGQGNRFAVRGEVPHGLGRKE